MHILLKDYFNGALKCLALQEFKTSSTYLTNSNANMAHSIFMLHFAHKLKNRFL